MHYNGTIEFSGNFLIIRKSEFFSCLSWKAIFMAAYNENEFILHEFDFSLPEGFVDWQGVTVSFFSEEDFRFEVEKWKLILLVSFVKGVFLEEYWSYLVHSWLNGLIAARRIHGGAAIVWVIFSGKINERLSGSCISYFDLPSEKFLKVFIALVSLTFVQFIVVGRCSEWKRYLFVFSSNSKMFRGLRSFCFR